MVSCQHPGTKQRERRNNRRFKRETDRTLLWHDQREKKATDGQRYQIYLRCGWGRVICWDTRIVVVLTFIVSQSEKKIRVYQGRMLVRTMRLVRVHMGGMDMQSG